jgi:hypothetical protein
MRYRPETEAARQFHCIKWSRIMGIPDLCRPNVGYQRIVAICIIYLQSGVHYYSKKNLCSATLRGCAMTIKMLSELQKYRPLINFNDVNNMAGVILSNIIKEENITNNKLPLITPCLLKPNNGLVTPTTQTRSQLSC